MKTYAHQNGEDALDWNKLLTEVQIADIAALCRMSQWAKSWVTCACGQQCAVIPRKDSGCPKDVTLAIHGADFSSMLNNMRDTAYVFNYNHGHVGERDSARRSFEALRFNAKAKLASIEQRSAEVLALIQKD
jgi:hypothetical protein